MQDMHAPYLVERLCHEARGHRPIVILREVFRLGDGSSEEAPPQGAVGNNADAQLAAGGDDLSLRVPADTFRQGVCLQRCLFLGCQAVLQTSSLLEGMTSALVQSRHMTGILVTAMPARSSGMLCSLYSQPAHGRWG
jgi:hypothetical protein